jgi:hypothetical protein
MKTKLAVAMLLTAIGLLLVAAGIGHAQPPQLNYTVYLPLIVRHCATKPSAYMSTNTPLIHVGETLTVTGAIFNECTTLVGQPDFGVHHKPTGILTPNVASETILTSVGIGQHLMFTVTLRAVSTGPVTLTGGVRYETLNEHFDPPPFYWDSAPAQPLVIRVVPN